MEPILTEILRQVGLGSVAALMTWLYVRSQQEHAKEIAELQQELRAESRARVDDAKAYTTTVLAVHSKVFEGVERLEDIADSLNRSIRR